MLRAVCLGLLPAAICAAATPRAAQLVANMTRSEKVRLLHGVELLEPREHYVGAVEGVERVGIPPIKLNDGPQGYRSYWYHGSSTQFPAGLSIGASWNKETARVWGKAMAAEFRGKGADVQLGPAVCVARIPKNGRNFEYLSGEDPFLGASLVGDAVEGIQGQGVMANIKHFILNNQETHRASVDAIVDERTIMEMYVPPFEAAVNAGVATAMCSYNLVNGEHACQNNGTLRGILRDRLGFNGWVMSDWLATHSTVESMRSGLDQEMPLGVHYSIEAIDAAVLEGRLHESEIDEKALNILSTLDRFGILDANYSRPATPWVNVTSAEHRTVCETIIKDSAVLLKNENNFLPLSREALKGATIVVAGTAASDTSLYGGKGSGHVTPSSTVSVLAGLEAALAGTGATIKFYSGHNKKNEAEAVAAARTANVTVVVLAENSQEAKDRETLELPQADFAAQLGAASQRVAAVLITPGAVLTDFDTHMASVMLSFMPGQQAGVAIADMILGDAQPNGRLPLTLPNVENEQGFTKEQWPGVAEGLTHHKAEYTERMEFGYRWYATHGIAPKYSFGHGLTYTTFKVSGATVACKQGGCNITATVENTGSKPGTAVVQVYVTFPASAAEPPRQLKAYAKVYVESSANVVLPLGQRLLSVWSTESRDWEQPSGAYVADVGLSSTNLQQTVSFTI